MDCLRRHVKLSFLNEKYSVSKWQWRISNIKNEELLPGDALDIKRDFYDPLKLGFIFHLIAI